MHIYNKINIKLGGFRPERSCTGQTLDLTQHIENDYKEKKTEVIFINLTAAYDTVNHNLLISKI